MRTRSEITFDETDVRRAAFSMICNHGRSAARVAVQRADNLRGDDVMESRLLWEHIARTIDTLQHSVQAAA